MLALLGQSTTKRYIVHPFFNLDGYHVCGDAESFRRGYCGACMDVIDLEGLCEHGSYPDGCGECQDGDA